MTKSISFVIPSYNGHNLLYKCLKTFRKYNGYEPEIIIVDDGSQESSIKETLKLCHKFRARLIQNGENLGFSKSVNKGIYESTGDVVVLYNNDVFCTQPIVDDIVDSFDIHKDIGIVGAHLLYPDGRTQHGGILRNGTHLFHDGGNVFPSECPRVLEPKYMVAVTGALFAIKRETIDDIGLLSEKFFLAFEDSEYCFRAWHHGWRIYYNPKIQAIHAEGATRGNTDQSKEEKGHDWFEKEKIGMQYYFQACREHNLDLLEHKIAAFNRQRLLETHFNNKQSNIIVKRKMAMGDVFFTTGIIRELKDQNPDSNIVVITDYPEVFKNNPHVHMVCKDKNDLPDAVSIECEYNLDGAYENQCECSIIEAYSKEVFGTILKNLEPELYPTPYDDMVVTNLINANSPRNTFSVVNLSKSWISRTFDYGKWLVLIKYLVNIGQRVFIVGTNSDLPAPNISGCINLQNCLSLQQTQCLIDKADWYIGTDSGILNIAYSTSAKCVGIYTCVAPDMRYFDRNPFTKFIVPPINLECRFCLSKIVQDTTNGFVCSQGTNECIKNIQVSQITDIIEANGRQ